MDRKELLERIKQNNEREEDPYTQEVESKGWSIGAYCVIAVSLLLLFLKRFLWGEFLYELIWLPVVLFGVSGIIKAVKLKTPWKIAGAVFWGSMLAVSFVMFVCIYFLGM